MRLLIQDVELKSILDVLFWSAIDTSVPFTRIFLRGKSWHYLDTMVWCNVCATFI